MKVFETVKRYAARYKHDAKLVTEDISDPFLNLGDFTLKKSRPNKKAYALKSFYPWFFITQKGYDRVLMVDDTCVFSPLTGDIFSETPLSHIGYTKTSAKHAELSFMAIKESGLDKNGLDFNTAHYANSGVVLYSSNFINFFSPEKLLEAKDLLYARYPHQTLLYYLVKKNSIPVKILTKEYNIVPALDLEKFERSELVSIIPHINRNLHHVAHFTGAFKNRNKLIEECSTYYLGLWDGINITLPNHN